MHRVIASEARQSLANFVWAPVRLRKRNQFEGEIATSAIASSQ
jgi:hypothetical protein